MKQSGYLFTAGVTSSQMRLELRGGKTLQTWDTCSTAIFYGGDVERAQKTFEDWCQAPQEGEDLVQTEIKAIVGAELVDQLLTESGGQPVDWPEISQRFMQSIPNNETEAEAPATADDPGYWVDANQAVPPQSVRLDIESLQRGLPEDIGSALNWSPDKKFLFLVTSLSAPSAVIEPNQEIEKTEETDSDEAAERGRGETRPALDEAVTRLPEMREKAAAALVEARNSVVAAWLWRKFAANTSLASNEILVNPCCGIMPAN
jgi:hypothetical protein